MEFALNFENPERSPGVYRWVDVGEVPFVRGDLAVRFHVPFAGEEVELFFGEGRVDDSEWDAVERGVPCCEKGVFPSEMR